ncbi:hypothetical protein VS877_22685, partial [Salmonella enterica subsp. enterica serovar Paratyphi A]|nr:hypothetical protein [Salmonella enterica subsp. enterica serovar Paratyphi A]
RFAQTFVPGNRDAGFTAKARESSRRLTRFIREKAIRFAQTFVPGNRDAGFTAKARESSRRLTRFIREK